ncbi:hypothetical protein OPV22_001677 [Ensete ventricosum]|uniref:Uncharacterized protein n=1 Tax=Ensete ventricosum TaxID=4639 RepID=A0AAV8RWE1_ENSVE|nr:hypothetical protein OPV22_001677 [Ensete ventricosum]
MLAGIKHYQDDNLILKYYADSDQVVDNGKVFKVQSEVEINYLPSQESHLRCICHLLNPVLYAVKECARLLDMIVLLIFTWLEIFTVDCFLLLHNHLGGQMNIVFDISQWDRSSVAAAARGRMRWLAMPAIRLVRCSEVFGQHDPFSIHFLVSFIQNKIKEWWREDSTKTPYP